jgi:hypothetical protein
MWCGLWRAPETKSGAIGDMNRACTTITFMRGRFNHPPKVFGVSMCVLLLIIYGQQNLLRKENCHMACSSKAEHVAS